MTNTVTDVHGKKFNAGGNPNGRRSGGFSLRRSLENQGVTTERAIQGHMRFVANMVSDNPGLDMTRYRVNPNNPNVVPNRIRILVK